MRPSAPVSRAVDLAVVPLRFVAELASPLVLVKARQVAAVEKRLAEGAVDEALANERLLADLARAARPTDPRLIDDRRIVHAEVLGRDRDRDHLEIRLRDARGVVPGLPVALGDAYVGRIVAVDSEWIEPGEGYDETQPDESGTAVVELVTAAGFHVGARVVEARRSGDGPLVASEILMTVGGVRAKRGARRSSEKEIRLAVHNPSDRSIRGGLARVHELFAEEEHAMLAEGLRLGEVRHGEAGEEADRELWVAPELDYLDGLFHVVVLCPPDERFGSAIPFETVLRDRNWIRTRPLSAGDPSSARSACKIRVGRSHGVVTGAAVTSIGANLVGRVIRAGILTSDVAFLDDPGFSVTAIARIDGTDEPQVLGRLDALGRDEATGLLRFRWIVRVSLALTGAEGEVRRADLFTGSAHSGLPAGFSFGETRLPVDVAPGQAREILVDPDVAPAGVNVLVVRTAGAGAS